MQSKQWRQGMTAIMTVLALLMPILLTGQTAATEPIVTVYKTPT